MFGHLSSLAKTRLIKIIWWHDFYIILSNLMFWPRPPGVSDCQRPPDEVLAVWHSEKRYCRCKILNLDFIWNALSHYLNITYCKWKCESVLVQVSQNYCFQTGFLNSSPCFLLVRNTDSHAPNSYHWLSQYCCYVGLVEFSNKHSVLIPTLFLKKST